MKLSCQELCVHIQRISCHISLQGLYIYVTTSVERLSAEIIDWCISFAVEFQARNVLVVYVTNENYQGTLGRLSH